MIFQLNTVATLFTKDKSPFLNLTSIIIFRVLHVWQQSLELFIK